MTPDQYRREGAEEMREAAVAAVRESLKAPGTIYRETALHLCASAIRAIDVDEVLAGLRPRCAECDCEDGNCTWIKAGPALGAADEIDRLRAEVERLREKISNLQDKWYLGDLQQSDFHNALM